MGQGTSALHDAEDGRCVIFGSCFTQKIFLVAVMVAIRHAVGGWNPIAALTVNQYDKSKRYFE